MKTWEVVKYYIKEHTRPKGRQNGKRYCELDDVKPGDSEIFISHSWGATFGSLVSAIVDICPDETFVWIDIFAVLQHPKNVGGEDLFIEEDLQFQDVIDKVQALILVCDVSEEIAEIAPESIVCRDFTDDSMKLLKHLPPMRSWCCFEILNAVKKNKPILLQAGRAKEKDNVQDQDMIIQPFQKATRPTVLNMLQLVDLEKAEAKYPEDRERILKQIKEDPGLSTCNAIVKGAITGAMAIIFYGTDHDEFRPVLQSVVTDDTVLIGNANYTPSQLAIAFQISVVGEFEPQLKKLAELGANPHTCMEGGDTITHWAAQGCRLTSLAILKDFGVDLDVQNDLGWNAVTWASSNSDGMLMAVEKLHKLGMNVAALTNLKEEKLNLPVDSRLIGITPVMWLVPAGNIEGIKEMVDKYSVDINAKNAKGLTALMFAVATENKELIKVLVKECGADLDVCMERFKQTAAHWAARKGKVDLTKELIKLGANKEATDSNGNTVSDLFSLQVTTRVRVSSKIVPNVEEKGNKLQDIGVNLGVKDRTDVRAATFMWHLESLLCEE